MLSPATAPVVAETTSSGSDRCPEDATTPAVITAVSLHREAEQVPMRDAAWSAAAFVAIGVGFGIVLGLVRDRDIAEQFSGGYVLEQSLSPGNPFG